VLERTAFAGHQIGNHAFTHRRLPALSRLEIRRELTATAELVQRMTGTQPGLFRAPYLEVDPTVLEVAAECGYAQHVGGDLVGDWQRGSAEEIAEAVLTGLRPGGIVILHDGVPPRSQSRPDRRPTVEAVRLLLPELHERGYELLTVSELLQA
jgi:peptidoglycan/xylan/chitin deacetylase (PgdA/CDA1 family)